MNDLYEGKLAYKCKDGTYYYSKIKYFDGTDVRFGISVDGYTGNTSNLQVPEKFEYEGDMLDTFIIGKKAFLGNILVKKIVVPETVIEISDWAFSQCPNLACVVFLNEATKLGKGIFEDCERLSDICLGYFEEDAKSTLIGAVPYLLKADYLLNGDDIGTDFWFEKWDSRLASFLAEDDEEGYTNIVLCGEEDIQRSEEGFISDKRKLKSKLCMLRLMNEHMLKDEARDLFTGYILQHMKGCESDEAWHLVLEEYCDKIDFFKLLADIGAITEDNIDSLISDLKDFSAETKSYLMAYKQENFAVKDIFASFVL